VIRDSLANVANTVGEANDAEDSRLSLTMADLLPRVEAPPLGGVLLARLAAYVSLIHLDRAAELPGVGTVADAVPDAPEHEQRALVGELHFAGKL
jgi:hypothetical protein